MAIANIIEFVVAIDQMVFSEAERQSEKREIRRKIFLERRDKLIPWKQLEKKIARHYSKGQNGRPPYPLSAVLLDGAVHTNLHYDQPFAPETPAHALLLRLVIDRDFTERQSLRR